MPNENSDNDTLPANDFPIHGQDDIEISVNNNNNNDAVFDNTGTSNDNDTTNANDVVVSTAIARTSATSPTDNDNNNRTRCNMLKNVFLLSGMWGMGLGASFVQIPAAENVLIGLGLQSIATVPLGLVILLSAPQAVIIPKLMAKYGEKSIFVFAACLGCVGALLQMMGILVAARTTNTTFEVTFLLVGAAVQSFTYASTNNIRFAVAYFSPKEFLPKATAFVILGGALGALCGPFLANYTRSILGKGTEYAGNFLQIAVMYFVFGVLAMFTDFAPAPPRKKNDNDNDNNDNENDINNGNQLVVVSTEEGLAAAAVETPTTPTNSSPSSPIMVERSICEILRQTDLALLIVSQCFSYNVMSLYMTVFQLPMIVLGYNADQRNYGFFGHMLGMFLPSLVSGSIMGYLGCWPTTSIGFLIMLLGGGLFFVNNSLFIFILGITVVGIGWNLSFVGPSAAVSACYENDLEKSKVQGFNDGIMLLTIGVFTLSASSIYEATGTNWNIINPILMGVSIFCVLMTFAKFLQQKTGTCTSLFHRK